MEKSINKVELRGYLGVDPDMFTTKTGTKVARCRMATTEYYKNREGEWVGSTTWHYLVFWGALADKACEEMHKGNGVSLSGRISNRQYTGTDGKPRSTSEIIVQTFEVNPIQATVKEKTSEQVPFMA